MPRKCGPLQAVFRVSSAAREKSVRSAILTDALGLSGKATPSLLQAALLRDPRPCFILLLSRRARFRQPNAEYQARRAQLRAKVDGPVVIFGYTGHEDASEVAIFFQEPYFYYLSGHDEPGAALVLLPEGPNAKASDGPHEILYLPPRDPSQEKWEGPKMGPDDPGVVEKTGFAAVEPFANLRGDLIRLAKTYANFYTLLPPAQEERLSALHAFHQNRPGRASAGKSEGCDGRRSTRMRQVKSAGELALHAEGHRSCRWTRSWMP